MGIFDKFVKSKSTEEVLSAPKLEGERMTQAEKDAYEKKVIAEGRPEEIYKPGDIGKYEYELRKNKPRNAEEIERIKKEINNSLN